MVHRYCRNFVASYWRFHHRRKLSSFTGSYRVKPKNKLVCCLNPVFVDGQVSHPLFRFVSSSINGAPPEQRVERCGEVKDVDEITSMTEEAGELNNSVACDLLESLTRAVLQDVRFKPWALRDDANMLFVQTYVNKCCENTFLLTIKMPVFRRLYDHIASELENITNNQLVFFLLSLVRLHLPTDDALVTRLLVMCVDRINTFNINELSELSCVSNLLRRSGFHLNGLICQALQTLLTEPIENTGNTYSSLANLVANTAYFWSTTFLTSVAEYALKIDETNRDVASTLKFLEGLSRFGNYSNVDVYSPFLSYLEENVHLLSPWQMSRTVVFLKLLHHDEHSILAEIQRNSMLIVHSSDLNIVDVVSLLNIMETLRYPDDTYEKLEEWLLATIQDSDIFLLRNLAKLQFLIFTNNAVLVKKFGDVVMKKLPDLVNSISTFLDVVNLVCKMKHPNNTLERVLKQTLLHQLECGQYGVQHTHMSIIGRFLMKSAIHNGSLPIVAVENMLAHLPHYSIIGLTNLSIGAANLQSHAPKQSLKRQAIYISSCINNEVIHKLYDLKSLNLLNLVVRSYSMCNRKKGNEEIVLPAADLYDQFASFVNTSNLKFTCSCVRDLKLYVPKLLKSVVDVVLSRKNVDLVNVSSALQTLGAVNYVPEGIDDITEVFVDLCMNQTNFSDDVGSVLLGTTALSILEVFPDLLLRKIFTADFLQVFDKCCQGSKPSLSLFLQRKLKDLNRSVTLNCPHLDVPWFHQEFCANEEIGRGEVSFKRSPGFRDVLANALGGEEYLPEKAVRSEYFHFFDYLCVLDGHGVPRKAGERVDDLNDTRVAIVLLKPHHYCSNERHLVGTVRSNLQELDLLGYKVVAVPYYELNSMALSEVSAKEQYLRNKIFV